MNFPLFIAKRYFVSKKQANVINIISIIAIIGVSFGTMAFIIVLSVFNGIEELVSSMFNAFDPDLRIELSEGKSFATDTSILQEIEKYPAIAYYSYVIEENVLVEYDDKQMIATMKAVDDNYVHVTGLDTMVYKGAFVLYENPRYYALVGAGVARRLGMSLDMFAMRVWAPIRTEGIVLNSANAFNSEAINISGFFSIQQEIDDKFIILPIEFARNLTDYGNRATAIELKIVESADIKQVEKDLQKKLGNGFVVKNRYEQKEFIYKIMKSEKWAVIAILSFILLVSSFNIIGTMIMLIIEKRKDISTLHSLGADMNKIRKIFVYEGWLVSIVGAVIGLILGLAISLGQQYFGWLKLAATQSFATIAYPVKVDFGSTILVFGIVLLIGYVVASYPVRYITRKFFTGI